MQVKVLGSAAGGGFPQWNCACANCGPARVGRFRGAPRTQAQLAWNGAPGQWTLLNASPDLRVQIEATPELWPRDGARDSPISDVIVLSAEVDQILGLLLLREFHRFRIHATASVRKILTQDNSLFGVLARFSGQVSWHDLPPEQPVAAGGALLQTLPLAGGFPGYVGAARAAELNPADAVIGLVVSPFSGGGRMAFLPGIGVVSDALLERLQACDVVFFDGTFWADDEPLRIPGVSRTARQMGHLPQSGPGGSLERLAVLRGPRKIFIHINNTNPLLDETSPEHGRARDAGWEVAWDGMDVTL